MKSHRRSIRVFHIGTSVALSIAEGDTRTSEACDSAETTCLVATIQFLPNARRYPRFILCLMPWYLSSEIASGSGRVRHGVLETFPRSLAESFRRMFSQAESFEQNDYRHPTSHIFLIIPETPLSRLLLTLLYVIRLFLGIISILLLNYGGTVGNGSSPM